MARSITCPSCGRTGVLPESFTGTKVRCPACKVISDVPGPRKAAPAAPAFDDMDDAAPPPVVLPRAGASARSRVAAASTPPPAERPALSSTVAIGLGIGGGLLVLGLIVVLIRSNGGDSPASRGPQANKEAVAQAQPETPPPGQPVASIEPVSTGPSAPITQPDSPAQEVASVSRSLDLPETSSSMLERVKAATVYIKVKLGKLQATGSGYVISTVSRATYIATNRHVVTPHLDEELIQAADIQPDAQPEVTVVFRSGEVGGVEQTARAWVMAIDTEPVPNRDVAILMVTDVKNPPRPIDPAQAVRPVEGMEIRILGFPFGKSLNFLGKGNPSITITKGSVGALRRDNYGRLALVQIDGSMHPGNSGGPIVDEKGRLVGMSVIQINRADNIGGAVPAAEVNRVLAGRVGSLELAAKTVLPGSAELEIKALLADPFQKLRNVSVSVVPGGPTPPALSAGSDGNLSAVSGGQSAALAIDRNTHTATGRLQAPLGSGGRRIYVQVSFVGGDGKTIYGPPVAYDVPDKPGRIVAVGAKGAIIAAKARKSVGKLGDLLDPDKDCVLTKGEKGIKLQLPGKLHTLSPQIKDKKNKQPLNNAPMVLAEVNGDFVAHVRIAGDIRPGTEPSSDPRGKKLPLVVQGGGLLLWEDKDNYLRLERSSGTTPGGLTLAHRLILEVHKDGKEAGHAYVDIPSGPLHVLMMRRSGQIRCLFSNDGQRWAMFRELAADFSPKVNIGLSAFNTAKKPYTAEYEDFVLLDGRDAIEEEIEE